MDQLTETFILPSRPKANDDNEDPSWPFLPFVERFSDNTSVAPEIEI